MDQESQVGRPRIRRSPAAAADVGRGSGRCHRAWSDDELLAAVRFYAAELAELPDLDPQTLDLATFRATVVAEHERRDAELREMFSKIKLATIDVSKLAGIDWDQLSRPPGGLPGGGSPGPGDLQAELRQAGCAV